MNIGPIQFSHPFCQAGLAGYSDRAMRLVARRRGCPYAVTEALLDVILLSGGMGLKKSIDINDEDHPIAGQIIGSEPDTMSRAAAILAERDYDVIDLNFACPVKKIKNKARGGHMLQDLPRAVDIMKSVRDTVADHIPTTISLRRGYDDSAQSEDRFHELIQTAWELEYASVRVHARTVEQKYQGRAKWPFLKQIKQQYPNQKILGSGDVFTAEDVVAMLETTGVDAVWIARGAIGNPWIFQHAKSLLQKKNRDEKNRDGDDYFSADSGGEKTVPVPGEKTVPVPVFSSVLSPPGIFEQRDALTEHFSIAMQIHGESLAGRRMRKMGIKYSRFHPQCVDVKRDFIQVHSLRDWTAVLDRWYSNDAPGVWPTADAANEVNAEETSCDITAT